MARAINRFRVTYDLLRRWLGHELIPSPGSGLRNNGTAISGENDLEVVGPGRVAAVRVAHTPEGAADFAGSTVESGSHAGAGWWERDHDARGEGGNAEPHAG